MAWGDDRTAAFLGAITDDVLSLAQIPGAALGAFVAQHVFQSRFGTPSARDIERLITDILAEADRRFAQTEIGRRIGTRFRPLDSLAAMRGAVGQMSGQLQEMSRRAVIEAQLRADLDDEFSDAEIVEAARVYDDILNKVIQELAGKTDPGTIAQLREILDLVRILYERSIENANSLLPRRAMAPAPDLWVDRGDDLQRLIETISAHPVVAVTAAEDAPTAGIGKTTLVLRACQEPLDDFPGGVLYARLGRDLVGADQASRVWLQWSETAANEQAGEQREVTAASLRRELSGLGKLLVVLDDMWAAPSGGITSLVEKIREALPNDHTLVITTRDLHVARQLGGELFDVGTLSVEDARALLLRIVTEANEGDHQLLDKLAELLGCIPLALSVAAGSLGGRGRSRWRDVVTEIERRLRLGDRVMAHVPRTSDDTPDDRVEVALDVSYDNLGPTSQERYRALGVFAYGAPFDVPAVAAVWDCELTEAVDQLALFRDRGLVTRVQTARGENWWQQHVVVRGHALSAAREEGDAYRRTQRRFVAYIGKVADDASAAGLGHFLSERLPQLLHALDVCREIGDRQLEGNTLGTLGSAHGALGRVQTAIDFCEKSRAISSEIGDRHGEGSSLGNLASAYYSCGKVQRAIDFHMQALVISREIPDRRMEGNVLSNLGAAHAALDQVETAIGFYDQALTISREIGDRRLEGMVVGGLGTAHAARGRVQTAMGFYRQALSISHGLRDGRNGGILLGNLGTAYVDLGQVETAISFYEEALAVSRKIGNLPHIQWLLPALAEALVIIGDLTALESVIAAPEIAETAQLLRVRLIVAATVAETDEQFEKTTRVLSDGSEELAFFVELCGRARRIVADGSTDALEGLDEVTRSAVLEVAKQIRERRARG